MLVDVGSRKLRVNWKHEPFESPARVRLDPMVRALGEAKGKADVAGVDLELMEILGLADVAYRARAKRHGKTTCFIEEVDKDFKVDATVECSLREGSYKKDQGRKESLEKALAGSGFNRVQRTQVWGQYFARVGKVAVKAA